MDNKFNNLKVVILECPYDSWDLAPTQQLFGKMVSVKLEGYRARHPYGVMPVDVYDFIAIHVLVCEETPDGLRVLTGYKTISYDRCKIHRVPFPMMAILGDAHARAHEAEVDRIIRRCETERIPLAYSGSWTLDPKLRGNKDQVAELRSIFEAMYVFCHTEYGFKEIVCGGVPRLKTDLLFEEWGHERVRSGGRVLPTVSVPHLQGDQIALMHHREFSAAVKARAEVWRALWERRSVIRTERALVAPRVSQKKKAA